MVTAHLHLSLLTVQTLLVYVDIVLSGIIPLPERPERRNFDKNQIMVTQMRHFRMKHYRNTSLRRRQPRGWVGSVLLGWTVEVQARPKATTM
jgi:hypothetical protein